MTLIGRAGRSTATQAEQTSCPIGLILRDIQLNCVYTNNLGHESPWRLWLFTPTIIYCQTTATYIKIWHLYKKKLSATYMRMMHWPPGPSGLPYSSQFFRASSFVNLSWTPYKTHAYNTVNHTMSYNGPWSVDCLWCSLTLLTRFPLSCLQKNSRRIFPGLLSSVLFL